MPARLAFVFGADPAVRPLVAPRHSPLVNVIVDYFLQLVIRHPLVVEDPAASFLPQIPGDVYELLRPVCDPWSVRLSHLTPPRFEASVAVPRRRLPCNPRLLF
jgi:hypothetical protein